MTFYRSWPVVRVGFFLLLLTLVFIQIVRLQLQSFTPQIESGALIAMQELTQLPDDECSGLKLPTKVPIRENYWHWPDNIYKHWLRVGCSVSRPEFHISRVIETNRWLIFATIFLATMLARIATSSWTVAMIVCATLLRSRGFTDSIGIIGLDNLFVFLYTAWFTALVYFLRSGSIYATALLGIFAMAAAYLGQINLLLACLCIPLFVLLSSQIRRLLVHPLLKRIRFHNKRIGTLLNPPPQSAITYKQTRPSFFTTLSRSMLDYSPPSSPIKVNVSDSYTPFFVFDIPFSAWLFSRWEWRIFVARWLGILLVLTSLAFLYLATQDLFHFGEVHDQFQLMLSSFYNTSIFEKGLFLFSSTKVRFLICVPLILLCAFIPPVFSVNSFFETSWQTLMALAAIFVGSFLFMSPIPTLEAVPFTMETYQRVLSWLEPTIITLGIASIFNIIRATDSFIQNRNI